jgi:membrane protein YdbS with pleckstrin-like domain
MANGVATGSLVSGLFRVFEAGEKLLVEQVELLRLDSRERVVSVMARAGLLALGTVFIFSAWIGLLIAWVAAFDEVWTLGARLAVALGAQVVLGVICIVAARRGWTSDDSSSST